MANVMRVTCWPSSMRIAILKKHPIKTITGILLFLFLILNLLTYNHAYSMMHFKSGVARTDKPENLGVFEKLKVLTFGISLNRPENREKPTLQFDEKNLDGSDKVTLATWFLQKIDHKGIVMLFHGYGECKSSLLPEAYAFFELGYSAFLVDCRGYGGSSESYTTVGIRESDDVVTAFNHLREKFPQSKLFIYGNSMGASAAMRAIALQNIKPDGLIVEAVFDRLLQTVKNRFKIMGIPSFPSAQLMLFWADVQMDISSFDHNPRSYAKKIHCPVLFIHGADDPRVTLDEVQRVYTNVIIDSKQLVEFAETGHEPCLAKDPDLWKNSVNLFLESALKISP